MIESFITAIGIIVEFVGVFLLFDKWEQFEKIDENHETEKTIDGLLNAIQILKQRINHSHERWNQITKNNYARAKRIFLLVVIGITIQLFGIGWGIFISQHPTCGESKCHYHHEKNCKR